MSPTRETTRSARSNSARGLSLRLRETDCPGHADGHPRPVFKSPEGIAVLGSDLYVADTGNHAIQKVTPAGFVSTYAGSDAGVPGFADDTTGTAARFDTPRGIAAVDSVLYVADTGNHVIRTISTLRKVNTFVGNSGAATMRNGDSTDGLMNAPVGITGSPGTIYFTDINENVVRKILF